MIKRTKLTNDYGADLLIKDRTTNKKIAVQAKRYKNNIGLRAIQEVNTAIQYYDCNKGLLVTNSHLTNPAKKLANSIYNVEYWEREDLVKKMNQIN